MAETSNRESAESSGSIWVANGDGTNPKKVIDDNSEMIRLCWSPDGESILFSSRRENKKQSEIFRVKLDGTALQKVATDKKLSLVGPSMSPDGRYLVVTAYGNAPEASILLMDLSNQNRAVLAHGIQAEPSILWDKR